MSAKVSPHEFEPLRLWDRWRRKGRCRACFYSRENHPVGDWTLARPLGDTSPADRKRVVRASGIGWLFRDRVAVTPTPPEREGADVLVRVTLVLCLNCIVGVGGECHTPGCALWMNRAPDVSIGDKCETFVVLTEGAAR